MPEFTKETAAGIKAACDAGAAELAEAFGRAFDCTPELTVGNVGPFDAEQPGKNFTGDGLLFLLKIGTQAAVVAIARSGGILPDWVESPDVTGVSKLATLAQELGMIVLPEDLMPDDFAAHYCEDLAEAIGAGGFAADAGCLPITLETGGNSAVAELVWPAATPDAMKPPEEPAEASEPEPPASEPTSPEDFSDFTFDGDLPREKTFDDLPSYGRSLLRIKVPVIVTLARKKQSVGSIVELAPGSLIQFDKPCEDVLDLEVADQLIGEGEAVKVGDKFGLRLTTMILPDERFLAVRGTRG
jgi:flagellar motor switch protein FliN/FliY